MQFPVFQRLRTFYSSPRIRNSLITEALKDISKKAPKIPVFSSGNMRVSPQKLNHLARMVKGMTLEEAKQQMSFVLKKRGVNIRSMINRVQHTLRHNYQLDDKRYYIKQCWVGKGVYLKRLYVMGRGRTGRMTRPSAHIKMVVAELEPRDKEMDILIKQFKKHQLFVPLKDSQPIYPVNPVWSRKQYKYLDSVRWNSPDNARPRLKK